MICSCGCRHSICEKTEDGHTERCVACGNIENFVHDDIDLNTIGAFESCLKLSALMAERHSRNSIGLLIEER